MGEEKRKGHQTKPKIRLYGNFTRDFGQYYTEWKHKRGLKARQVHGAYVVTSTKPVEGLLPALSEALDVQDGLLVARVICHKSGRPLGRKGQFWFGEGTVVSVVCGLRPINGTEDEELTPEACHIWTVDEVGAVEEVWSGGFPLPKPLRRYEMAVDAAVFKAANDIDKQVYIA